MTILLFFIKFEFSRVLQMHGPKWPFLLARGPGVVVVKMLGHVVLWVELPVQRRLCPIFVSGVGLLDIHEYSAG